MSISGMVNTVMSEATKKGQSMQLNTAILNGKVISVISHAEGNGVKYAVSSGEDSEIVYCAIDAFEAAVRLMLHGDKSGFGADYPLAQMAMPKLASLKWIP